MLCTRTRKGTENPLLKSFPPGNCEPTFLNCKFIEQQLFFFSASVSSLAMCSAFGAEYHLQTWDRVVNSKALLVSRCEVPLLHSSRNFEIGVQPSNRGRAPF